MMPRDAVVDRIEPFIGDLPADAAVTAHAAAVLPVTDEAGVPASMPEPVAVPTDAASTAALRVSVVVPTYKRPDMLQRCLDALCRQTLPGDRYEVLVCDDGPSPDTRARVEELRARERARGGPLLHYVPVVGTQGPSGARNRGWEQARAAIVAFTDDDTVPEPGWLERGLAALTPEVAAASGRVVMPIADPPTDYELNESGLTRAEFVTANCFVRRDALAAVGGFDERFTMAWREDSDLQFTLLRAGLRIVKAPDAVVVHPVRPAPPGISLRQQRKVFFDALLYKKHPERFRERIRSKPPWNYFVIVACLAAMLVAVMIGSWALGMTAFVIWAALTLAFTWLRLRRTSRAPGHVLEMLLTSIAIPPVSVYWRLRGAWHFRTRFL